MTKRERLYPEIKELREEHGLKWWQIGDRLGISLTLAQQYYSDPTGEKVRARKMKNSRACLDCGTTINKDGSVANPSIRCLKCEGTRKREDSRKWIVESMQEWSLMFCAPPSALDWNPTHARKSPYCAWKADRYERTGVRWPSTSLVQANFGSWNAGLTAAGFDPLTASEHWIGHAGIALRNADQEMAA